jgi:hypothetical protein
MTPLTLLIAHKLSKAVIVPLRPVAQVERAISLSDDQHANLYDLSAAIYRAAGSLATACPAEDRFTALGRLDARQRQLQALRQGTARMTDTIPTTKTLSGIPRPWRCQPRPLLSGNVE